MNKIFYLVVFLIFVAGCSLNKNSKFWTSTKNIKEENNPNFKELFIEERKLNNEFNANLKIKFSNEKILFDYVNLNNYGQVNFNSQLKKISRYKFSKIKNFHRFEPEISFDKNNIVFFDNKGSIVKFDDKSKLKWKKNYYTKLEKKLQPILQFANNGKFLIVADNIAKYYLLNLEDGDLIWSKNNLAPFNSQIKIYDDKFFIVDFSNTLRCFSLKNGNELWNVKTEKSLIRSQKKLSMVIVDKNIYFKNSVGDISAVNIQDGELLWQLPTQSTLLYESAFTLETSDLISDSNSLYFSNNRNQFFSVDLASGSFNWENKINSNLRPTLIEKYLFTISLEGYLVILEKDSGNIIRITDVFSNFKDKKRKKIKPTGFIVGLKNIYLSTSNGKLLIIDIRTGKTVSTLKVDNEKISSPYIFRNSLYVIKDNSIIRLN